MAIDDSIPSFTFSADDIASIKASLGTTDVDESQETPISEVRPKRRGRPPGSKNKTSYTETPPISETGIIPPAPLTKRDEREVAKRLSNLLQGATGMGGMVKPYLPMTEREANDIAEPLASYLVRNEPTNGVAREILENYDILAMVMGVGAYGVRVYSDRKQELAEQKPANTKATQIISERAEQVDGRGPNESVSVPLGIQDVTRGGRNPFDI